MSAELTVMVDGAAPFETDDDEQRAPPHGRGHRARARRSNVLVQPRRLRRTVQQPRLRPDHAVAGRHALRRLRGRRRRRSSRTSSAVFYNDNWDGNRDGRFPNWPENYASFVKVVRLAQEAGATIDISFQNLAKREVHARAGRWRSSPTCSRTWSRNHGLTNVRWAEVGNEPNSGGLAAVTLAEYDVLVRTLDAQLRAARAPRPHPAHGSWPRRERRRTRRGRTTSGCSGSPPTWATSSTRGAQHVYWSTTTPAGSSTGSGTSGTS